MTATTGTVLPRTLSQEEVDDLSYMMQLTPPGIPHTLDLSDDVQHRSLMFQLQFAGRTPENSPQLFAALAEAREHHIQNGPPTETTLLQQDASPLAWTDANILLTLGDQPTGPAYNSTALSTIVGGTISTQMILNLYDLSSKVQIGHNAITTYGQGQYQTLLTQATAAQDTDTVQSYYTVLYQKPNQPTVAQRVYLSTDLAPKIPPVVTNPVHRTGATHPPGYIAVALNRGTDTQPDMDYWYSNAGPTNAQLQVTGYVRFNSSIITPLTDDNFTGNLYIVNRAGGAAKPIQAASYLPFMKVSTTPGSTVNNDTLTWTFNTAQFGPYDPWKSGDTVDLNLTLTVETQAQPGNPVPITVTSAQDAIPSTDTTVIDPLRFFTSCLAGDTLITLADGTEVPIELIRERGGHVLADSDGRILLITANIVHTRDVPLLTISTDLGHKLRLTPEHPVVTSRGVIIGGELQVGDEVTTRDGSARLIDISSEPYDGLTYNLCLAEDGKEHEPISGDARTMFANGILVGDFWTQEERYQEFKTRKESVLARIPAEWHQDYLNSLTV